MKIEKIIGIGTDIIEIERIKEVITRTKNFKEKVYTKREIQYVEKKKNPYPSYAGRFAAKEAISKALGRGVKGFSLKDIEILNNEWGKPEVFLSDNIKNQFGNIKIEITISHSRENAVSTVIIYE